MSLPLWEACHWLTGEEYSTSSDADPLDQPAIPPETTFSLKPSINKRIHLYLGDFYKLPTDALIVGQNESLNDTEDGNEALFHLAGPEMETALHLSGPIQTGESVATPGFTLPTEWVIHAVGPKYDDRYITAADHALHSSYKSALFLAAEKEAKSVVISCIYKFSKRYPRLEAAHVSLRTVRKFLDHNAGDGFQRIMFCVPSEDDYQIYSALMPAYFPRTVDELISQPSLLPPKEALGDEWGEIVLSDRVLKVSAGPQPLAAETLEEYRQRATSVEKSGSGTPVPDISGASSGKYSNKTGGNQLNIVGEQPRRLSDIDADKDGERVSRLSEDLSKMSREERKNLQFQAMIADLEEEDLDDIEAMKLITLVGKDNKCRTVVFLSAPKLKLLERQDPDRVVMVIMKVMEPLRCVPFTLIYGVGGMTDGNHPNPAFVQEVFDVFACRYRANMHRLIILHASIAFRMYFFFALPFLTTPFWSNYVAIDCIRNLSRYMDVSQLELPQGVVDYDNAYYR